MLSKRTIVKLSATASIIAAIALTLTFKSADFADKNFRQTLQNAGIEASKLPLPEKRIGALRYKNIMLSDEGETAIDALTITYSPHKWNSPTSITINGLFLSGELDINGKVSIKGLPDHLNLSNITAPLEKLSAHNINFSILSAHLGGIRGTANIAAHKEGQAFTWTGNIDTQQDQFELIAKFNGQINQSGTWVNDFEIENAKLERSFGKFTRVYGAATWIGKEGKWQRFETDLNAGGFIANGTAWKNAAIAIQSAPTHTKSNISAKSAGIEELELSIDTLYKNKDLKWNARIHAPTASQLISYFTANNMMPIPDKNFASLAAEESVTLQLGTKKNSLIFNIKNKSQKIDIKGKIEEILSNNYRVTFISEKNFENGFDGAKCKTKNTSERVTCSLSIIYKDAKYHLKD